MAKVISRNEMSGAVLDDSHFKFHVECKAKIIHALHKMKKGADFLSALSKLRFSTDKRWTRNSVKDPNVEVLLEIMEDYKKLEKRPSRAKVLGPLIEYAIGLYASDLFYRERGEWFLMQIMMRGHRLTFHEVFTNPENWYPNKRSTKENFDAENSPDAPSIEEEYVLWYGVDPTIEERVISYDIAKKEELITEQRTRTLTTWAEKELADIPGD